VYDQTITAVETTDASIGMILDACQRYGYVLIVTADHGNAEEMLDAEGNRSYPPSVHQPHETRSFF
jgi:2,3-bisphosphoglycerate-independent phosphoglycerate mutase